MADNLTTTTQVDPAVNNFYDRVLLSRALPMYIHSKFAQTRNIPSKSSATIKFRRYSSLTAATTPISEGVTPPGQQLAKTDLTALVKQFADYVHITDWVDLTVEDKVLAESFDLLGEQLGLTVDTLVRDILAACASSTNASNGANGETPTEVTKADVDGVVRTLRVNNAKLHTRVIKAGTGQGTSPIRPSYFGLCHSYLENDIEAVSGFKSVSEYPSQSGVDEAEFGSTGRVRWLTSSNGDRTTTVSPDTFLMFILGQNAYAVTNLEAGNLESIVKGYGSAGTADPVNQRATAGWKLAFVSRILNDNFMHCLNVTASDSVG
jgi:N4-gp56 family major capsid protein